MGFCWMVISQTAETSFGYCVRGHYRLTNGIRFPKNIFCVEQYLRWLSCVLAFIYKDAPLLPSFSAARSQNSRVLRSICWLPADGEFLLVDKILCCRITSMEFLLNRCPSGSTRKETKAFQSTSAEPTWWMGLPQKKRVGLKTAIGKICSGSVKL